MLIEEKPAIVCTATVERRFKLSFKYFIWNEGTVAKGATDETELIRESLEENYLFLRTQRKAGQKTTDISCPQELDPLPSRSNLSFNLVARRHLCEVSAKIPLPGRKMKSF